MRFTGSREACNHFVLFSTTFTLTGNALPEVNCQGSFQTFFNYYECSQLAHRQADSLLPSITTC